MSFHENMITLVDIDDVLADFHAGFLIQWRKKHPEKSYLVSAEVHDFYVADAYPQEWRHLVEEIHNAPNFYRSLPLIPEAKGGLEAIERKSDVFLCSAPHPQYENCVLEKYEWVDHNLGKRWVNRIILTRDKTLVLGNLLIDDKPEITGVAIPLWEHVIYDRPYNRHIVEKRRMTWANWKDVLREFV